MICFLILNISMFFSVMLGSFSFDASLSEDHYIPWSESCQLASPSSLQARLTSAACSRVLVSTRYPRPTRRCGQPSPFGVPIRLGALRHPSEELKAQHPETRSCPRKTCCTTDHEALSESDDLFAVRVMANIQRGHSDCSLLRPPSRVLSRC